MAGWSLKRQEWAMVVCRASRSWLGGLWSAKSELWWYAVHQDHGWMVFEAPRVSYGGMPYLKITAGWSLKRQEWAMVVCRTSRSRLGGLWSAKSELWWYAVPQGYVPARFTALYQVRLLRLQQRGHSVQPRPSSHPECHLRGNWKVE